MRDNFEQKASERDERKVQRSRDLLRDLPAHQIMALDVGKSEDELDYIVTRDFRLAEPALVSDMGKSWTPPAGAIAFFATKPDKVTIKPDAFKHKAETVIGVRKAVVWSTQELTAAQVRRIDKLDDWGYVDLGATRSSLRADPTVWLLKYAEDLHPVEPEPRVEESLPGMVLEAVLKSDAEGDAALRLGIFAAIDALENGKANGPNDADRATASTFPSPAYWYALDVDKGPHGVTRAGACKIPEWAVKYARNIDKGPRDDTRNAALGCIRAARKYALEVDLHPHSTIDARYPGLLGQDQDEFDLDRFEPKIRESTAEPAVESQSATHSITMSLLDELLESSDEDDMIEQFDPSDAVEYAVKHGGSAGLRAASSRWAECALHYAKYVDRGPHAVTRTGACRNPENAFWYALEVDHKPTPETWKAVQRDPGWSSRYKENEAYPERWIKHTEPKIEESLLDEATWRHLPGERREAIRTWLDGKIAAVQKAQGCSLYQAQQHLWAHDPAYAKVAQAMIDRKFDSEAPKLGTELPNGHFITFSSLPKAGTAAHLAPAVWDLTHSKWAISDIDSDAPRTQEARLVEGPIEYWMRGEDYVSVDAASYKVIKTLDRVEWYRRGAEDPVDMPQPLEVPDIVEAQKPVGRPMTCEEAYLFALEQGPSEETKAICLKMPYYAYMYAHYIEKKPSKETRDVAMLERHWATSYAKHVDKYPHPDIVAMWGEAAISHAESDYVPAPVPQVPDINRGIDWRQDLFGPVEEAAPAQKDKAASAKWANKVKAQMKACWDNSVKTVQRGDDSLMYVEGFVRLPHLGNVVVEHGWVEAGEHIIDPTMPDNDAEYFPGVRYSKAAVLELLTDRKPPFVWGGSNGWGGFRNKEYKAAHDQAWGQLLGESATPQDEAAIIASLRRASRIMRTPFTAARQGAGNPWDSGLCLEFAMAVAEILTGFGIQHELLVTPSNEAPEHVFVKAGGTVIDTADGDRTPAERASVDQLKLHLVSDAASIQRIKNALLKLAQGGWKRLSFGDLAKLTESSGRERLDKAKTAYEKGLKDGPSDATRADACLIDYYAYMYGRHVDKGPRDDTRAAACRDSSTALGYASHVDKCPRDDTRAAASRTQEAAKGYAIHVDKHPHPELVRQHGSIISQFPLSYIKEPTVESRSLAVLDSLV